jgi:hypothetical protein
VLALSGLAIDLRLLARLPIHAARDGRRGTTQPLLRAAEGGASTLQGLHAALDVGRLPLPDALSLLIEPLLQVDQLTLTLVGSPFTLVSGIFTFVSGFITFVRELLPPGRGAFVRGLTSCRWLTSLTEFELGSRPTDSTKNGPVRD